MPTPASPAQSSAKAQQELFLLSSSLHPILLFPLLAFITGYASFTSDSF